MHSESKGIPREFSSQRWRRAWHWANLMLCFSSWIVSTHISLIVKFTELIRMICRKRCFSQIFEAFFSIYWWILTNSNYFRYIVDNFWSYQLKPVNNSNLFYFRNCSFLIPLLIDCWHDIHPWKLQLRITLVCDIAQQCHNPNTIAQ